MAVITYTITFRENPGRPQRELILYTKVAADKFADLICEQGGVAIVTEDVEEDPPPPDLDTLQISPAQRAQLYQD